MDQDKSRKNRAEAGNRGPLLLLSYAGALEAPETGRRFTLDGDELIIGRSSDAHIQIDRDSVSRRHARLSKTEGGWLVQDLQSTNGSYVNDVPIREHKLTAGDQLKVGSAIFRYLAGSNIETLLSDELYQIAVRDGLTHALSRRAFVEAAEREDARAHKLWPPLRRLCHQRAGAADSQKVRALRAALSVRRHAVFAAAAGNRDRVCAEPSGRSSQCRRQ